MCRLALMNRAALQRFDTHLSTFFADLEYAMGGDGNGVAALWSETGGVRTWKGRALTTDQAATRAQDAVAQGADWVLFHSRMATSGGLTSRHCHPFRYGQLVLAHNGHSHVWHELGALLGLSDSACITRTWSRLHLPVSALAEVEGVFLGFHAGAPFAVKGGAYNDLTVSVQKETGAMLFASELDQPLRALFDHTVEAGRLCWNGEMLDLTRIKPRPRLVTRATSSPSTQESEAGSASNEKPSSTAALARLREWYQGMDCTSTASVAAAVKKDV